MRKKIYVILLIISLFIFASCSRSKDHSKYFDGVSFQYFTEFTFEEKHFEIHLPVDIKESIITNFKEGSQKSSNEYWTINYVYNNEYQVLNKLPDEEIEDILYLTLLNSKDELDAKLDFISNILKNGEKDVQEYNFINKDKKEMGYRIVVKYLPLLLIDDFYEIYAISFPIKVFIAVLL